MCFPCYDTFKAINDVFEAFNLFLKNSAPHTFPPANLGKMPIRVVFQGVFYYHSPCTQTFPHHWKDEYRVVFDCFSV